jgi:hypothetical protein
MARVSSNRFEFLLNAESNRFYRVEMSTNAGAWLPAQYFPRDVDRNTSVVATHNVAGVVSLPMTDPTKVFRVSLYAPANEACNNNMRRFRFAKDIWWRETRQTTLSYPGYMDLVPYCNTNNNPFAYDRCPAGGAYWMNQMDRFPACSVPAHVLDEPRE